MDYTPSINRDNPVPVGEQLQDQIRILVDMALWPAGYRLPTVKRLAEVLELNYNTVASAYRALEARGYLTQHGRGGTCVAKALPEGRRVLEAYLASDLANRALASGLDTGTIVKLVAAHTALRASPSRLRVAAVAARPLEAEALAKRAGAFLGDSFECIPQTVAELHSSRYHFILIDPGLSSRLKQETEAGVKAKGWQPYLTVPAGAD